MFLVNNFQKYLFFESDKKYLLIFLIKYLIFYYTYTLILKKNNKLNAYIFKTYIFTFIILIKRWSIIQVIT